MNLLFEYAKRYGTVESKKEYELYCDINEVYYIGNMVIEMYFKKEKRFVQIFHLN
jgi:hypothetical protein